MLKVFYDKNHILPIRKMRFSKVFFFFFIYYYYYYYYDYIKLNHSTFYIIHILYINIYI